MAVRSVELFGGFVPSATDKWLFTCPPQTTVILKTAYGYSYGYNAGSVILIVGRSGQSHNLAALETVSGKGYRWDGWAVLEPGDELRCFYSADGQISLWVSGARLEGTGD